MARTPIIVQESIGRYPGLPVTALSADFTFEAADIVDGNEFAFTGKEVIIVRNDDALDTTLTVQSVAGPLNREGDLGPYTVGPGLYAFFTPPLTGFQQAGNLCFIDGSDADLMIAVIRFP